MPEKVGLTPVEDTWNGWIVLIASPLETRVLNNTGVGPAFCSSGKPVDAVTRIVLSGLILNIQETWDCNYSPIFSGHKQISELRYVQ
ncbi:uncharacterized protein G2W53_042676 [Senna tora]|uniref:Uncharacterized protein n=1 Tax=Senna tora TaxID=362788 RepID=A0A834SJ92_9FABA|nr:uncharacterized protein G2W53_042676 [Senna tora]